MKKTIIVGFLLSLVTISTQAQSFKLWYANNVTDVADLDKIEDPNSGLTWREVPSGTQGVAGNMVEVNQLKNMLSQTRMKNLDDKRQFWKMRDHGLLCFRVDDLDGVHHTYEVIVSNDKDSISQTVDDYFFVNAPVPRDTVPYIISVRRMDNDETVQFKYHVYEWDNENLYMFMLDQKRQVTGETYKLEYVTGYLDEYGDLHKQSTTLDLKDDKFQSFYVPQNSTLLDVFLMSGDDKKLRIDKSKLHTGIDLSNRMNYMEISSTFNLDKHEGREMMNFNWLGTGLYEKYDTLYISLFNEKGRQIKDAIIHPERVDHNGNRIYDPAVKYDGYDNKTKQHRVITMSNPAYIEILVDGYLPMLYKYPGAVDDEGIVNTNMCQALLTMQKGVISSGFNISNQHFMNLNDEKAIIVRNNVDHRLCSIDAVDLSQKVEADTISYMDDLGNDFPKLLNNKVVEHYAQFEASFSTAKGSTAPDCQLFATNIATGIDKEATEQTAEVVRAAEFTSFYYDYYFVRFNLLDVIDKGTTAKVALKVGDKQYAKFPYLRNVDFVREDVAEEAEEEVNENYVGDEEKVVRGFGDADFDLKLPIEFKFSFKPVSLSTSFEYNIRKNLFLLKMNMALRRPDERPNEEKKFSDARKELKEVEKYDSFKMGNNKRASILGDDVSFDDWIYDEIDDIFDISSRRIGEGWFGGAKLCFKMPPSNIKNFQVMEAAGQLGYGIGMRWNAANNKRYKKLAEILEEWENWLSLTACGEASMQLDFGIKSFQEGTSESMSSTNMGYFSDFSGKASLGASLDLFTPEKGGKGEKKDKISHIINLQAGLRLGGKAGFQFGVEGPFDSYAPGIGLRLVFVIIGQAYINLKTPIVSFSANAGFKIGARRFFPDDDHNPFHPDFPYWLNSAQAKPTALAYRRISAPETSELSGKALVNDLALDANPHFLDANHVVYNDLGAAADYNDDKVVVADITNDTDLTKENLSVDGLSAGNHARSKRGEHEIVAFEQLSQPIGNVDEEHLISQNSSVQQTTRIRAAMRQGTGNWTYYDVTTDDGYADLKPVVAMQENGHAAMIYQHGKFDLIDPNESADSLYNVQFKGNLMLRTFDGTSWSEPTPLYNFNLDHEHTIQNYDLLMRGDTALVAATLIEAEQSTVLRYASKHISSNTINYYDETIQAYNFHMKRVGKNAVIAMIYAASDSISDIYVKTINMTGRGDGRQGNDLGVGYNLPNKVKIVADSNADDLDNFAVMWTQMGSVYRGDQGEKKFTKNSVMMLQASRIFVSNALQITDPITLGAEIYDEIDGKERNLIITSFDGFLDDAKISAVYTLADMAESGAVIMHNEKYFRNSYEWNVSYGSASLLGSSTLPVVVSVKNTGTSAINGVTAVINGTNYPVSGAYVKPFDSQDYVIEYPINDDFDGYLSSQVIVDYINTFHAQAHPRNRAKSFTRQASAVKRERVALEDIECNVVGHRIEDGKNVVVVELIDHASLHDDMKIYTGIFAQPNSLEEIVNGAMAEVASADFIDIGGVRKAYAVLEASGITDPIQAYVNCHIVDMSFGADKTAEAAVKNARELENPTLINLFPAEDPATFVRHAIDDEQVNGKVIVTTIDNGVRLDGLTSGSTIRLFSSNGINVFKKNVAGTTLFVPLTRHDVYLITTGEEVLKIRF